MRGGKENAVRGGACTAFVGIGRRSLLGGGNGFGGGAFGGAAGAAGLGGGELGVFFLEAFDATGGVDEFLFAGVEGVVDAADFDFDVLEGGAGFEGVAAGAAYFGEVVLGVDFFFHGILLGFQRQIQ